MREKRTFLEKLKATGPAAVIASAFVGPGTITTATNAGVNFGYALLWAVIFSGIASIVIMNMASRLAILGKRNIIDASVDIFANSNAWRVFILGIIGLVCFLTGFGFEAGNLIGATTGFSDITGLSREIAALIMSILSILAIVFSTPNFIEMIMKYFIALMGLVFVITAIIAKPDVLGILKGFIPTIPDGAMVTTIALIGTTIIGINLVFHSIATTDKWTEDGKEAENLENSYFDTNLNVWLGVAMTTALVITTSATLYGSGVEVDSPIVFATSLEPTLGRAARVFSATGLVLAGLSSAIATPFMVGQIIGKIFKWERENDNRPKIVAIIIVLFGMLFAMFGRTPVPIILFAQATSGVFLPIISILFVVASNSPKLGKHKNTTLQNVMGILTVIVMFL